MRCRHPEYFLSTTHGTNDKNKKIEQKLTTSRFLRWNLVTEFVWRKTIARRRNEKEEAKQNGETLRTTCRCLVKCTTESLRPTERYGNCDGSFMLRASRVGGSWAFFILSKLLSAHILLLLICIVNCIIFLSLWFHSLLFRPNQFEKIAKLFCFLSNYSPCHSFVWMSDDNYLRKRVRNWWKRDRGLWFGFVLFNFYSDSGVKLRLTCRTIRGAACVCSLRLHWLRALNADDETIWHLYTHCICRVLEYYFSSTARWLHGAHAES